MFQDELGTLDGVKATLNVNPDAKPKFFKARHVQYALKERIEQKLGRLVKEVTIEPVQLSQWVAPIV